MIRTLFLLLGMVLCGACTLYDHPSYLSARNSKFIAANYEATETLVKKLTTTTDPRIPLVVATLVSIDELTESSRLGRAVSEQIGSRLVFLGFPVVELKLRGNIFVKHSEGELLLSREIQDLARSHQAQAVVVGTYSVAKDFIYINLKMVCVSSTVIIAAHDYVLPITPDVRALLESAP